MVNMKSLKYIFIATALGISVASCHDLDLEPKGLIYENVLFKSESGVKKYFSLLYQDLPIEDFNYAQSGAHNGYATDCAAGWHVGNIWEAQKASPASAAAEAAGRGIAYGNGWGYWPYGRIRDINIFIKNFPQYKENYTEDVYNSIMGEAHFLRAFYYFGIVKRYGGVPIVKEVLDPTAPLEELCIPRNTEYDCWKFIYEDLKFAMENASDDKSEVNRANRYTAAALMSRAMIYAGSIAKYSGYINVSGPAVNAGLMGMSQDKAAEFYKYAYDACKFINEAGYKLHDGSDKEKAYTEVFIENTEEDIMIKQYGSQANTPVNTSLFHCWDDMVLPKGEGLAQSIGAALQPVWELVQLYQTPAIKDANDNPVRFTSVEDFWNTDEMEPRCRANFFFAGMTETVSGQVMDIQGGVYKSYPGNFYDGTTEVPGSINDYTNQYRIRAAQPGVYQTVNGKNVKISGKYGLAEGAGDEKYTRTGMFIRKYVDYKASAANRIMFGSSQSWKVFRYGEILLNWAEAAYELGIINNNDELKVEAIAHVNEIRDRAGARRYAIKDNPEDVGSAVYGFPIDENLQFIRDERARELCYENQRLFDIRRWRIADIMFKNGKYTHTLLPYYVISEDKYIFLTEVEREGRKVTFEKSWYYEQIPGGEINKNPALVRNDGY